MHAFMTHWSGSVREIVDWECYCAGLQHRASNVYVPAQARACAHRMGLLNALRGTCVADHSFAQCCLSTSRSCWSCV
jgi:hypothetical protein